MTISELFKEIPKVGDTANGTATLGSFEKDHNVSGKFIRCTDGSINFAQSSRFGSTNCDFRPEKYGYRYGWRVDKWSTDICDILVESTNKRSSREQTVQIIEFDTFINVNIKF